jgi:hypothetical protein
MSEVLTLEEYDAAILIMTTKNLFDETDFFERMKEMTYGKYLAIKARFALCKGYVKCVCWEDTAHNVTYRCDDCSVEINCLSGVIDYDSHGDEHGRCNIDKKHEIVYATQIDNFEILVKEVK